MSKNYRTAESVCKGHPDKLSDLIAAGDLARHDDFTFSSHDLTGHT